MFQNHLADLKLLFYFCQYGLSLPCFCKCIETNGNKMCLCISLPVTKHPKKITNQAKPLVNSYQKPCDYDQLLQNATLSESLGLFNQAIY